MRYAVLIAIENEARGFFRGLGINHATEFDTFLVRAARQRLHMFFLIGDNADGPPADARVSAQHRFAILRAIFFALAGVHNPGATFPHVVLLPGIARKDSV